MSAALSSCVTGSKQRPFRSQGPSKLQKSCVGKGCALEYVRWC